MKQDNLHIQVCFLRSNVLNENDETDIVDIFNETFEINFEIDVEKFLKNQFVTICIFDKEYQRILNVFKTKERIIKEFFLVECIIIDNLIQYCVEKTFVNSNADFFEYRLNYKRLLMFNNDKLRLKLICLIHDKFIINYFEVNKIYEIFARKYF